MHWRRLVLLMVTAAISGMASAQNVPPSPDRPWHFAAERQIREEATTLRASRLAIDATKSYSLAELVDIAERNNPETRVAWERALAQAAALGVARSELYPLLAAAAVAGVHRDEIFSFRLQGEEGAGLLNRFFRQTVGHYQAELHLSYTVFDFGARAGRIAAAQAEVLAANFAFNDTHRRVIYEVEQAYYQLLNAYGQEDAARASLANAQTVQQAAEERLKNGLATLPDVLEARSATAQAEYDLQAVLGAEQVAAGNLVTALGTSATATIHVQPLKDLPIPDSLDSTVDEVINRALVQRPDLLQQVADIRAANAGVKETRAAYYPSLHLIADPVAASFYGLQQQNSWENTAGLFGGVGFRLNWTVFDGGARKNRLAQARANVHAAEVQTHVTQNRIADEVWAAYSNLNTAFRQRQSAIALLEAASQSYAAALESYNYGVRSLLDVTAAQRTLAQARSADVLARTQVLTALADLAFRTGDSIQPNAPRPLP